MPPHPRVVDASEACLWFVQDEEGCQVSGVGGDDDHGEAGPDHTQHAGGEAAGGSLACQAIHKHPWYFTQPQLSGVCVSGAYSRVEEDSPGEPDGAGQV